MRERVMGKYSRPETGFQLVRRALADAAVADDAASKCAHPTQLGTGRFPPPRFDFSVEMEKPARPRQNHRDGMSGNLLQAICRNVCDPHAAASSFVDRDIVQTDS